MSEQQNQEEFTAKDPGEYKQKRRIRTLLDAKEQVPELEREIERAMLAGHLDEQTGNHALRRAVEHFIFELEPVLKHSDKQLEYWGGYVTEDGQQIVPRGDKWVYADDEEKTYGDDPNWTGPHIGSMALPDGSQHAFYGLGDIVDAPNPLVIEWEEDVEDEFEGEQTETQREVVQIPRQVLMSAFRTANAFLFDIGLDLDTEDERPFHDFGEGVDNGV